MIRRSVLCCGVAVLGTLAMSSPALADVTVTNNANSGPGSLRQALLDVNPGGTITIPANIGQITLTTGQLVVAKAMTINGAGASTTVVSGNNASRVFDLTAGPVTINGLTVKNGNAGGANGGGILSGSVSQAVRVFLNNDVISGNTTGGSPNIQGAGGGVSEDGSSQATLTNVTVDGNAANGCGGVAQFGFSSSVWIRGGSVLSNNNATIAGGACNFNNGRLEVTRSTLRANHACATPTTTSCTGSGGQAGAIVEEGGLVLVEQSVLDSNTAGLGGALDEDGAGAVVVIDSTLSNNQAVGASVNSNGGAVEEAGAAEVVIIGSTLVGNHADHDGGAVDASGGGMIQLATDTITNNSAGTAGGGVSNVGGDTVKLTNVTMQGNRSTSGGGNLHTDDTGGGTTSVSNTILAAGAPANCAGTIGSLGHNIDTGINCGLGASGDRSNTNPQLASLASNGGPTQTMALSATSPAIDAGDAQACDSTDQRGVARPDQPGTACDIGAYEFVTPTVLAAPHGTKITKATIKKGKRSARFTFTAQGTVTGFKCALARVRKTKGKHHKKPKLVFRSCKPPKTYKHLKHGKYIFEVKAFNSSGTDPQPAIKRFRI